MLVLADKSSSQTVSSLSLSLSSRRSIDSALVSRGRLSHVFTLTSHAFTLTGSQGKKRTAAIRKQLNELVQKSKHAERQEVKPVFLTHSP